MKSKTLCRVVALAVAASVVLGAGTAEAANISEAANSRQSTAQVSVDQEDIQKIIDAASAAYSAYQLFFGGDLSVRAATSQILAAIQQAKDEIISEVDAIAAADARRCSQDAVLDFPNFNALTRDNQQAFALAATSCVNLIDSLLITLTDKAALDRLGIALDAVGPIALIVRSRTGLTNNGLLSVLVHSTQRTISVMTPTCFSRTIEGRTQWTCQAYNLDTGGPEPNRQLAQTRAGRRTSWPLAKAVLPQLTELL